MSNIIDIKKKINNFLYIYLTFITLGVYLHHKKNKFMKNILFLALFATALVSCQEATEETTVEETVVEETTETVDTAAVVTDSTQTIK